MATNENEVLDSQFVSENVGFIQNCFDNSFTLHSSVITVKEYLSGEQNKVVSLKENKKKKHNISHNSTVGLDSSKCNITDVTTHSAGDKIISKNLRDWGLPVEIARKYETKGITEMFEWQVTCLSNPKVLMECRNLVYSAPTSAGKTLVAELIMIKTILERQKKVIIILPFVSIVREKMFYLQDILSSSGIRVEGFMGSQSPPGGLQAVHVAICTIEKANSLINRLLDEETISELGAVIVDELHLLGDPHRGYILELLLTKVRYVSSKFNDTQIQIVGMSATLPNLEILASWLEAELFITSFRPIPLDEYCLVGSRYYNKSGEVVSSMDAKLVAADSDYVLKICLDTISEGCSVLIFCMTKNRCENLAQSIASSFYKLGCSGNSEGLVLRNQLKTESIFEVLEQLKNCPVSLDHVLKSTISFGVAYHHAGLTFDERDIIEGAFKSGAIRVLVATSTLSSGVNLPARKVIIRTPVFQRQPINILTYKQMIGRAGRMGKDIKGESILICTEAEKKIGFDLMMGALDPVKSCIEGEDKFMRAVLEMVASQVISTKTELDLYAECTLLFTQNEDLKSQNNLIENTLKELKNYELVRIQKQEDGLRYVATPLGKACLSSSMAPNDGLSLFCELQKARQCLVLETDLHLIYLVTPYSVSSQWGEIDWLHLLTLWESLTKAMKKVGELVGVQESFIIRCLRGGSKMDNSNKLNVHKRFYTALALQDLVNEVPLSEVAAKFQCARGFLQSLQQAAATFAGMVTAFCHQLGWKNMEMLISQFQDRLHFGIHSELLELMKLPSLNGVRARSLFDSGFETIASIASADTNKIENALYKAVPFQSEKEREGDDSEDIRRRNKIKNIWITGGCAMTTKQAAENLINEARKYLQLEIGVSEIKWDRKPNDKEGKTECFLKENGGEVISTQTDNKAQDSSSNVDVSIKVEKLHKTIELPDVVENVKTTSENFLSCDRNNPCKNVSSASSMLKLKNCVKSDNFSRDASYHIKDIQFERSTSQNLTSGTIVSNSNANNKDEIIWDSLNFTEGAIENVTKMRSNLFYSPNISFGDGEGKYTSGVEFKSPTSSKISSVKDISLFSSDGDNSSLFEDSLPIDMIPSKLLDNGDTDVQLTEPKRQETNYMSLNSNTLLHAFKSTLIESDDDEDIKLIYEEGKTSESEVEAEINASTEIEVINTQEINTVLVKNSYISPFKRHATKHDIVQPLPKKMKKETNVRNASNLDILPVIKRFQSKQINISIASHKLNGFLLREEDIVDNLHIFDKVNNASIYVNVKYAIAGHSEIIGSKILKQPTPAESKNVLCKNGNTLSHIVFCYRPNICILLDLTSLGSKIFSVKRKLCEIIKRKSINWQVLSLQSTFVSIKRLLGIELSSPLIDISLLDWLIDSDEKSRNILYLAKKYCDIDLFSIPIVVNNKEKKHKCLDSSEESCLIASLIWKIAEKQNISVQNLYQNVQKSIDVETQVAKILSNCEYFGLTVDKALASQLLIDVKNSQETLQKKAFKICGYHFNFNSSKDVAKVLGIYKGRKVSTKKSVLTSHNSPMSSIIIYWRKLNSILTKTLYPLTEKACIYSEGDRINPSYTMYTCTGRVSMHEPNLQNVPRTFSIPMNYLSDDGSSDVIEFNCRNIFKAAPGFVLVSADYCQLEMRILTHYSGDAVLTKIMSSDVDVFKSIAASWSNVPEEEVDDDLRQKAKQLCYGILYGMGNKTLSQHLDVAEVEAAVFMDTFYKTYPSIKVFTLSVIEECRKTGFVETLTKRRRYLPDINSLVPSRRSAAERQAVNTTIQGSAADIAKAAMCAIDTRTDRDVQKPRLILQMHDELIYEVPEDNERTFISILKQVMEGTVQLKVPLPVKVKKGLTWGTLQEVKVDSCGN